MIEQANRRMAEVHNRKTKEASDAAKAIQQAKQTSAQKQADARKEEKAAINKALNDHSSNVVK